MRPPPGPGAILPRAASLALWLHAAVPGDAAQHETLRAVVHDDEPHSLDGDLPAGLREPTLEALLHLWTGRVVAAAALFPGPGDVMGAPAAVSAAAIEAEECVLLTVRTSGDPRAVHPDDRGTPGGSPDVAHSSEHWALVPEIETFGSALEPGHLVTWQATRIPAWEQRTLGTVGSLADAERALQRGLREATEALTQLDVSQWRDDAKDAIVALREPVDLRGLLPRTLEPRRTHVFQSAARLRAIVDLATVDDGGAVNMWQADQRSTALREIDRVARRAMAAATFVAPLPRP